MMKPRSSVNPFKILRERNGFGIIEVMVAAGLLLIISIGMTSLITNMQKEQRRQTLLQVLVSQKNRFENAILNPNSWQNTLTASSGTVNVNTYCLVQQIANSNCSAVTVKGAGYLTTYQELILRDGATTPVNGNVFYDGTAGTNGFTESGAACTTFTTAAAGNDACPIGYRVSWAPQSASDTNPKITVYAKMIFNPSDSNPFKTFLNASASSTTINTKYDVNIDRTGTVTAKAFRIQLRRIPSSLAAGSHCYPNGFGTCSVGSYSSFPYDPLFSATTITDPHGLVTITGNINPTIKNIGKYKCSALSHAFGTDGAYLRISRDLPAVKNYDGSTFASKANYAYSNIIIDTVVDVTVPNTTLSIQQKCDTLPTSNPAYEIQPQDCSLGFSGSGSYGGTDDVMSLSCILID